MGKTSKTKVKASKKAKKTDFVLRIFDGWRVEQTPKDRRLTAKKYYQKTGDKPIRLLAHQPRIGFSVISGIEEVVQKNDTIAWRISLANGVEYLLKDMDPEYEKYLQGLNAKGIEVLFDDPFRLFVKDDEEATDAAEPAQKQEAAQPAAG